MLSFEKAKIQKKIDIRKSEDFRINENIRVPTTAGKFSQLDKKAIYESTTESKCRIQQTTTTWCLAQSVFLCDMYTRRVRLFDELVSLVKCLL